MQVLPLLRSILCRFSVLFPAMQEVLPLFKSSKTVHPCLSFDCIMCAIFRDLESTHLDSAQNRVLQLWLPQCIVKKLRDKAKFT